MLRPLDTLRVLQGQVATTRSLVGRLLPSSLLTRPATTALPMGNLSSMDTAETRHTLPPAGQGVIRPMDSPRHHHVIKGGD